MTSKAIYTDGYLVWTEEYIHYLKNGMLKFDPEFLSVIQEKQYVPPIQDEFNIDRQMEIYDEVKSHF